jgi:protease-4
VGYVYLGGIHAERVYAADALAKLGIEPQVNKIERYKSAAEMVTRTDMSPEAREMTGWILSGMYPRVLEGIAEGFDLEPGDVEAGITHTLPLAQDVVDMGLASGVRYWDEMTHALPRPGGEDDAVLIAGSEYAQVDAEDVGLKGKKKIAVVHAQGLIAGNTSGRDPLFGMRMGHESVNRDLRRALKDKDVVGVVFRVDSGGGSSLTSNRIARMVELVDGKKPVVVSMVDVAASGGYTISYRARMLIAGPNTITGSIGSITGKFVAKGLYNRLGITKDGVGIGPRSDFFSDYRPWTESEFADVREEHWAQYRAWIARIAEKRGVTAEEIDAVGRGRVWTGAQALEHGLIDRLGTLDTAVAAVKEAAGVEPDAGVTLVHYPQPEGFVSSLLGMDVSAVPGAVVDRWIASRTEAVDALLSEPSLELTPVAVP